MSIHALADMDMDGIFSRNMKLGGIGTVPVQRRITATAAECSALAELFGLPAIAALSGDFTLAHARAGVIDAQLRLKAQVTQSCVVSLEHFDTAVTEDAVLRFVPAAAVREGEAVIVDAETLEGPDEIPYQGEMIDLGAVLAEQLALALDPYPRKPGATLPADLQPDAENPFAALRRLPKPD
jgi:hypothetical protein